MFIIPDNVLQTLVCRNCKNYLSARPVKVYPNRSILCGRCSNDDDDGVVSVYDALAEQGLFKCINRYEGCDKILRYAEVLDHEKTCTSHQYKCPLCTCAEITGTLAFFNHFKESHKASILQLPSFEISNFGRKFSRTFLYVMNNFMFLINILMFRAVDHTQFISLNAVLLGTKSFSDKIYQKYILHTLVNGKKENKQVTKRTFCSPYTNKLKNKIIISNYIIEPNQTLHVDFEMDVRNAQTLISMPVFNEHGFNSDNLVSASCSQVQTCQTNQKIKFFITNEFQRMWSSKYKLDEDGAVIYSLNRTIGSCCYCQNMFLIQSKNHGIYKCVCVQCSNSNNLICSKCFFFGVILCINGNGKAYQFAVEETAVFKTVQYYCKWGCGEHLYSWCLKPHELNCPAESGETLCPVRTCNEKFSAEKLLIKHIQEHSGVIFQDDNLISSDLLLDRGKKCIVLPVRNYFVTITWDKILSKTFSCSLFSTKNKFFGNFHPVACFKRQKRVDYYRDLFTVDTDDDTEFLIILMCST